MNGLRSLLLGGVPVLATALSLIATPVPARAAIKLNELTVRPAGPTEWVELYNSGPVADVGGWLIRGNKGAYTIPAGTLLPPASYTVFAVGDISDERGGVTSLIDIVRGDRSGTGIDSVYYGTEGSAPLPPAGSSLARAPDAADVAAPPPDPGQDGLAWTIDFTPTSGAHNDAPAAQPGVSLVLNEFDPAPHGGGDFLEVYNPTAVPTPLNGWVVVNGDAPLMLNGFVPPLGFTVTVTPPGYDLDATGLLYLFRFDGVRVDQLGFHDAWPLPAGNCFERCPDGSGPFLGYDYLSSGGGSTFVERPCTFGASNCTSAGVPGNPPEDPGSTGGTGREGDTMRGSWGEIKAIYR